MKIIKILMVCAVPICVTRSAVALSIGDGGLIDGGLIKPSIEYESLSACRASCTNTYCNSKAGCPSGWTLSGSNCTRNGDVTGPDSSHRYTHKSYGSCVPSTSYGELWYCVSSCTDTYVTCCPADASGTANCVKPAN